MSKQVVVLNYAISSDYIASVHKVGCKDIERDQAEHAALLYGPFDTLDEALADYVDGEMAEMGYGVEDVKVYGCCKGGK